MLDLAIAGAGILLLLASAFYKPVRLIAWILCVNYIYNLLVIRVVNPYTLHEYFQTVPVWLMLFAIKDAFIFILLGFRNEKTALILMLSFAFSCLLHQFARAQALTNDVDMLTVLNYRPVVMYALTIIQLTTGYFILIGGGISGGKRVNFNSYAFNYRNHSVFYSKTYEAAK